MSHELEFDILEPTEVDEAVKDLPGWQRAGKQIKKEFEFEHFSPAIDFVNRVAKIANSYNHHPDIEVHFKKVLITLWTHKKDATTKADIVVAKAIEDVA